MGAGVAGAGVEARGEAFYLQVNAGGLQPVRAAGCDAVARATRMRRLQPPSESSMAANIFN